MADIAAGGNVGHLILPVHPGQRIKVEGPCIVVFESVNAAGGEIGFYADRAVAIYRVDRPRPQRDTPNHGGGP